MHELSLAQGLLDQLIALAKSHDAPTVLVARVDIGDQAGIVVDSFCFGFDALKKDNPVTEKTALVISNTDGTELILSRVEME